MFGCGFDIKRGKLQVEADLQFGILFLKGL
jgi:hypothetical protein